MKHCCPFAKKISIDLRIRLFGSDEKGWSMKKLVLGIYRVRDQRNRIRYYALMVRVKASLVLMEHRGPFASKINFDSRIGLFGS